MTENASFEGWAIVELFGHQQIAGLLSEQSVGGSSFLRVDVPETNGQPGFTKFYGGGAIYAITPTTEELATIAANKLAIRPVSPWIVPARQPQLIEPGPVCPECGYEDGAHHPDCSDFVAV